MQLGQVFAADLVDTAGALWTSGVGFSTLSNDLIFFFGSPNFHDASNMGSVQVSCGPERDIAKDLVSASLKDCPERFRSLVNL